jgi:hypothetical protein
MPFNLAGLTAYVDQVGSELASRTILQGQSMDLLEIDNNIKHAKALNIFDQNLSIQVSNCSTAGFSDPSGNTSVLTQRILTVCPTKFNGSWCIYGAGGIEDYWLGFLNKPGQYHNEVAQFEKFVSHIVNLWAQQIDYGIWQAGYVIPTSSAHSGETTAVSTYPWLSSCVGFLSGIYNTADSGTCNFVTYSSITNANIIAAVDSVYAGANVNILMKDNLSIWTSPALLQQYKYATRQANGYNYYPGDAVSVINGGDGSAKNNSLRAMIPNTNVKLVGTVGMTGLQNFILAEDDNLVIGSDLIGDYDNLFHFYSEDFETLRMVGRMKLGTQSKFPQYITAYGL